MKPSDGAVKAAKRLWKPELLRGFGLDVEEGIAAAAAIIQRLAVEPEHKAGLEAYEKLMARCDKLASALKGVKRNDCDDGSGPCYCGFQMHSAFCLEARQALKDAGLES